MERVRSLLIEIRFHTPRNVPGNSMKSRPVTTYTLTRCCSWASRSEAASPMIEGAAGTLCLRAQSRQRERSRKQYVVFQMNVPMEIAFELLQPLIEGAKAQTCIRWWLESPAERANRGQQFAGTVMFRDHSANWELHAARFSLSA